jgi:hypothetical protein
MVEATLSKAGSKETHPSIHTLGTIHLGRRTELEGWRERANESRRL